jgi:hypothetical protein
VTGTSATIAPQSLPPACFVRHASVCCLRLQPFTRTSIRLVDAGIQYLPSIALTLTLSVRPGSCGVTPILATVLLYRSFAAVFSVHSPASIRLVVLGFQGVTSTMTHRRLFDRNQAELRNPYRAFVLGLRLAVFVFCPFTRISIRLVDAVIPVNFATVGALRDFGDLEPAVVQPICHIHAPFLLACSALLRASPGTTNLRYTRFRCIFIAGS